MKVKELIEKLKEFDGETDVVIRFAVSNTDDIGYVLIPKIIDEYITSVAIYANYDHTAEDCAFMGQVDLKQAYENERKKVELEKAIDLMAKTINEAYFTRGDFQEWFENSICKVLKHEDYTYLEREIKQYFENKAKEVKQ